MFLSVIDWIMRTPTAQARNGIQWTHWMQLDDLDFADDLTLLSHTHRQMQKKAISVKDSSAQIGLNINRGKTNVLWINITTTEPVWLDGDLLEELNSFTYLGRVVDIQGDTEAHVKTRIGKARALEKRTTISHTRVTAYTLRFFHNKTFHSEPKKQTKQPVATRRNQLRRNILGCQRTRHNQSGWSTR